jgi:hypothetical protein
VSNQYNDLLVSQMNKPLDAAKNAELYRRIVAGDAAAREEMIVGNMPLAIANVEKFIRRVPQAAHLRDDLVSAAFTGLVKAVNGMMKGHRVKKPDKWNPACHIGTSINHELSRAIEDENPIHLPHESERLAKRKGQPIELPEIVNTVPERFEVPSYEKELEMRDLIESCCTCEEERTFVTMREAGYTFVEIAAAINMPLASTHAMAKKLNARVQRKLEALRDE